MNGSVTISARLAPRRAACSPTVALAPAPATIVPGISNFTGSLTARPSKPAGGDVARPPGNVGGNRDVPLPCAPHAAPGKLGLGDRLDHGRPPGGERPFERRGQLVR